MFACGLACVFCFTGIQTVGEQFVCGVGPVKNCCGHVGDTFLPVYVTIHLGIAILTILKSGLGSFIMEQLRDDYPLAYILSVAVAPFSLGETPL